VKSEVNREEIMVGANIGGVDSCSISQQKLTNKPAPPLTYGTDMSCEKLVQAHGILASGNTIRQVIPEWLIKQTKILKS
jgi:hypothetical protein